MKRIDFEAYAIIDHEGKGRHAINRLARPYPSATCECCGEQGEYEIRADWDPLGQCIVYECQECLVLAYVDTIAGYNPDTFVAA